MAISINLDALKNDTARANAVRETVASALVKALSDAFGDDAVVYIPDAIEPNGGAKINGGSIAVRVGTVTNKDGFAVDAVAIVSTTAKSWNDKETKKAYIPAISLDDIIEAVEAETAARAESKAKKEAEKAKNIAKKEAEKAKAKTAKDGED